MQSHSSRHQVSEALADRHPYSQPPFEKEPRKDEVANAYGERQVPKLVAVLQLQQDQLPESERLHCLKLFGQLLSTQETKISAIQAGAIQPLLTWLAHPSSSTAVRQSCCRSIASICQLRQGRAALAATDGLGVLSDALVTTPDAAVQAVKVFASCTDGVDLIYASPACLMAALVNLINHPSSTYTAVTDAATCVAGLCRSDNGVVEALSCEAPSSLGSLCNRALRHSSAIAAGNVEVLEVLRSAAEALLVISHHPDGKTQLRQAECIPVLSKLLSVRDDVVAGAAAAGLASLAVEVDSKLAVMSSAGEELIRRAREGKQVIAAAARTALLCAAEHLDARRKLELLLPTSAELHQLLGDLPAVPPDYKCDIWTAEPTPFETANGDDQNC